MDNPSKPPADRAQRIDAQAREWVVYLRSDRVEPSQVRRFAAWLANDPAHADAFRLHEQLLADLAQIAELEEVSLCTPGQPWKPSPPPWMARRLPAAPFAALAAAALLAIGGLFSFNTGGSIPEPHYMTQIAEVREVSLPDGTRVTLGPRSRLDVSFSAQLRVVRLVDGEAFFDVVSDPARPFHVLAGDRLIRVLGTRFNVTRAGSVVRVAVVEGRVELLANGPVSVPIAELVESAEVLTAGDRALVEDDSAVRVETGVDENSHSSWQNNWLSYEDASLAEIVAHISRYESRRIILSSPEIGQLRLTAAFGVNDIDQFLAGMEAVHPITVDRSRSDRIVISPSSL
jgi:transmembrane sensor